MFKHDVFLSLVENRLEIESINSIIITGDISLSTPAGQSEQFEAKKKKKGIEKEGCRKELGGMNVQQS